MKKYLFTFGSVLMFAMSFAACEAEDEGTDAYVAPNPSIYDGCMDFRAVACDKWVECGDFSDAAECTAWFDSEDGYGGCTATKTDEMTDAATGYWKSCLGAIPGFAPCADLNEPGIFQAIPACGQWIDALPE